MTDDMRVLRSLIPKEVADQLNALLERSDSVESGGSLSSSVAVTVVVGLFQETRNELFELADKFQTSTM
jgi:hypothetical protein